MNTYNSSWQHYPDLSWENSQGTPQPPLEHKSSLEGTMAKLKRAQAESAISQAQFVKEMNQPLQEELIFENEVDELAISMAELAKTRAELCMDETKANVQCQSIPLKSLEETITPKATSHT